MSQKSRDRVQEMHRQREAAARRRRSLTVSAAVVLVLAGSVGVAVAVGMTGSDRSTAFSRPPEGTVQRYGVARGQASAPVMLTVFEDFQCPACRSVETYLADTVSQYVDQGTVRVVYRPIAFLDDASTTDYSSRALGAAACVLDESGPQTFVAMHDLLYRNQPAEGTDGLSDDQLVDLAGETGADEAAIESCTQDARFAGWADAATEQASKEGVNATPTILVNGQQLEFSQSQDPISTLRRAVGAAQRPG